MNLARKLLAFLLCAVLLLSLPVPAFAADSPAPFALTVLVEGGNDTTVRAYAESYDGNLYLSLTDLSLALQDTERQFRLEYSYTSADGEAFTVSFGKSPTVPSVKRLAAGSKPGVQHLGLMRNRFYVGNSERKYYTYRSSDRDLYMSLADIQLALDITAEYISENCVKLYPAVPFVPDLETLLAQGYFDAFNSILLADADTGRALFTSAPNRILPIASLSKLMSCYLLAEAQRDGRLRMEDVVTISDGASRLSLSADGIIYMTSGAEIPVQELFEAMLLASSNESALALAEHVAGSEALFVEQMNEKAAQFGLRSAVFYTPHGLPVYTDSAVSAKLQNRMSAQDLFRLIRRLLADFPQITDITAMKYTKLKKLDFATANSNPLVFNLDGVNGLKTGSTNKAGYCLAASLPVTSGGETHTIVLILLGAETAEVRGQAAEILMRYAQNYYEENGF